LKRLFLLNFFFISMGLSGISQDLEAEDDKKKKNTGVFQNSESKNGGTLEEFGRLFFESLKFDRPEILQNLAFTVATMEATVEAKTTNSEVKEEILKELNRDREGLDKKMQNGMRMSYVSLKKQEYSEIKIDWSQISYSDFKFEENEKRTTASEFRFGVGYLHFTFDETEYRIEMGRMAELLVGWRANDLEPSATLVN